MSGDGGDVEGRPVAPSGAAVGAGRVEGVGRGLAAALILGALSGLGDWIWWHYLEDGALLPALGHGILFFAALAVALGWGAGGGGAVPRLLSTLPGFGLVLAGIFYPVAMVVGYGGALLVTWSLMWVTVAWALRWAARRSETATRSALRGILAALLSGLAFWSVSDMWTKPSPGAPSVLDHSLRWAFALAPGLLCLLVRRRPPSRPDDDRS